jgi:hypothetical protein
MNHTQTFFSRLVVLIRHQPRPLILTFMALLGGMLFFFSLRFVERVFDPRNEAFLAWRSSDPAVREQMLTVQREACPGAPFILPANGWIGLLYGDPRGPYTLARRHQGIDIFSNTDPNITPVYAAYDGYVSRHESWVSALIIRVPDDPLTPGRQIWLYYTHMAASSGSPDFIESAFPPGIREVFVEQGTLLGYTGDYAGANGGSVWVHLHFSIVLDDGSGNYLNELDFNNTVDPSRYLGIPVNYGCAEEQPACAPDPLICKEAVLSRGGS